ncbi:hypothetical protein KY284_012275 [Solanum tuberosum]|nr:hypothetical protein KY284_012275 [Solanum tuberosum]
MSVRIGMLETCSLEPNEEPGTSKGGKRKLSNLEVELEEKLKTSESKLVASLERNSQLVKDLCKIMEKLNHSLKWTDSSKILSNLANQKFNGRKRLGCRQIEPPYNPHSKYMSISDNLLCTHCGKNGHLKEKYEILRGIKERQEKFLKSRKVSEKKKRVPGPSHLFSKNTLPSWTERREEGVRCWYKDSGCSRHMTGDTLNFLSLEAHQGGGVSFGGGKKGSILSIGRIGRSIDHSIDNVHYVDGLKYNLLSVSQIYGKGNEVKFMSDKWDSLSCLSAQTDDTNLWHRRLGHISTSLLNKLVARDLVRGLPRLKFSNDKVCDACAKGKQTRSSFKAKKGVSTTRPLELLHMDICGPVRIQSRGGLLASDLTMAQSLKTLKLKAFVLKMESITIYQHQELLRKTELLKGRTEHWWILLAMLIDSALAINFWAEAVNTTCYVTNRCLIRFVIKKTPYELLNDRKPSIAHLKPFVFKCFVLNNGNDDFGKFHSRSDEGVFVGFSSTSKAYRVFNKRTLCVEESMHVIFDEYEKNDERREDHELEELIKRKQDDQDAKKKGVEHTGEPGPSGSAQEVLSQNPEDDEAESDADVEEEITRNSEWKHQSSHPSGNLISPLDSGIQTRSRTRNLVAYSAFISSIDIKEAL